MRGAFWVAANAVLLIDATRVGAQAPPRLRGVVSLEVRSSDSVLRVLHVDVTSSERALFGMAVIGGAPGVVSQDATGGRATTPVMVRVANVPGWVRLSVPRDGPRMRVVASGDSAGPPSFTVVAHALEAIRDSVGLLIVRAVPARRQR